ncbi:restriction endonuclease subunit S [Corynebacterium amycolatum]|uniref:restriction endonuclease subunit S n=1 Tax=Corynebacterium amycolatum TaxID=43765 RepID=UPI0012B8CBC6|nr:restriction endonuclease subunit S [Corynebacterium amycolatum]KAA9290072.1 hypothetical protein F6I11_00010 [Corynebacterium amycolatum]
MIKNDLKTAWIDEIPDDWRMVRASLAVTHVERPPLPDDEVVTCFRDGEVTLRSNRRTDGFTVSFQEIGYQHIEEGDLVIHSMDGGWGAIGVSDSDGKASPVVHAYRSEENDVKFIAYVLRSMAYSGYLIAQTKGIRERSTQFDRKSFSNLYLPLPDLETQRRIADYLDKEISEMDALIEEFEGLITSLKSRRRVFAVNLVRDDQYPLVPLSTIVSMNSGDSISSDVIKANGNYPVYGGNGLRGYTNTFNCETERVLIGRQGALCGNVHRVQPKFFATEHALVVKPKQNINLIWLEHALREMNLGELSTSVAQPGITATKVLFQRIHFPSPVEQEEIAQRLQKETAKTDALIEESTRLIENLKARKTALITEVVTGRKEV